MFSSETLSKIPALLSLWITVSMLSACATIQEYWTDDEPSLAPNTYTVNKGDTLYSIAWLYELDYRRLAQWNDIKAPKYLIYPGQQLNLSAPRSDDTAAPAAAPPKAVELSGWYRPLSTAEVKAIPRSNAILMKGKAAEVVRAVAAGTVVYSGFNLKHYHGLIIIKHEDDIFSVYGNNQEILVTENEQVVARQEIARLSDQASDANLYFEIRHGNRSLKARNYLAALKISIR